MPTRAWIRWSIVLGFALGGFFDGILLHQILQWHHLLSAVPAVDTLRAQVLWDGYFHASMYLLAALGLGGLWRSRAWPEAGAGQRLAGGLVTGFGLWHLVDAVLAHAVLGLHRIRPESAEPLAWDLGWALAFGLVPSIVGWRMLRRPPPRMPLTPRPAATALVLAGLVTAGMAVWSLRPAADARYATVVFAPRVGASDVLRSLEAMDARLVWSDPAMAVVVVDVAPHGRARFYAHGALLVGGAGLPAGCFGWSRR
ncbi:MAG: DUF2243 domain-containing protein [Steroidobacteraceae bacterium]|jgi:uncharacterized membrane protein|nr:DUF2243 domain-containing protein [Steroidobacteraceae bacterium]